MKFSIAVVGLISFIAGAMALPTENGAPPPDTEIRFISMVPKTLMCIGSRNGLQTAGNPVQLMECDFDKAQEQQWEYKTSGEIQQSPSRAQNGTLYCLDIHSYSGNNQPAMVVNPCNNTPAQKWHFDEVPNFETSDFRIRNEQTEQCLEAVEGDNNQDSLLTISPCREDPELFDQRWSYLE